MWEITLWPFQRKQSRAPWAAPSPQCSESRTNPAPLRGVRADISKFKKFLASLSFPIETRIYILNLRPAQRCAPSRPRLGSLWRIPCPHQSGSCSSGPAQRRTHGLAGGPSVDFTYLLMGKILLCCLVLFLISKYYSSPTWSTCMQCMFLGLKATARKISSSPTSLWTECEKASLAQCNFPTIDSSDFSNNFFVNVPDVLLLLARAVLFLPDCFHRHHPFSKD